MTSEKTDKRRRYSAALKVQVMAECEVLFSAFLYLTVVP